MKAPKIAKKVIITGSSGFVGANIIRALIKKGFETHIILRKNASLWRIKEVLPLLHVHYSDLSNVKTLAQIIQKVSPDYIFHLSAYGAYSFQEDLSQMVTTNIVGLTNLLEASKNTPYKLFINTGSSSEYGYKKKAMNETDLLVPESFYAATKASATHIASVFAKIHNKPIVTFRLFSAYGPYEDPRRLIPAIITSAITDKEVYLTKGAVKRDFIFVDDIVRCYIDATKKKHASGAIYNIGTGKQHDNADIAKIIKTLNKNHMKFGKKPYPQRQWDTSYWVADTKLFKSIFSFQPISLKDGLKKTYDWFIKTKNIYPNYYERI